MAIEQRRHLEADDHAADDTSAGTGAGGVDRRNGIGGAGGVEEESALNQVVVDADPRPGHRGRIWSQPPESGWGETLSRRFRIGS